MADYLAQDAARQLPAGYTPEQVRGYEAQRAVLADSMTRTDNAVLEMPFQATGNFFLVSTKPASRGTVLLDLAHADGVYAEPVLDYGALANPVDALVLAGSVRWARRVHETESVRAAFAPVELSPGANVTSDEALVAAVRRTGSATTAHLSGTCAMMPRELGGVVDPELRVYGVTGLSVVDASVQPLIPGAHLCATVYAVAEKVGWRPAHGDLESMLTSKTGGRSDQGKASSGGKPCLRGDVAQGRRSVEGAVPVAGSRPAQ